ncbi:hypothetical protein PoB_007246500 [Plakobranchus ocellatus]|uniref:Uncharacterized protein n=1 Tax=Plakobranchus ocellatus TaxID=259542 RepID=A0AAV4DPG8_9GAST|nr:hypothetical protein PoB_007246500 [Plakobranchus ocellatus]
MIVCFSETISQDTKGSSIPLTFGYINPRREDTTNQSLRRPGVQLEEWLVNDIRRRRRGRKEKRRKGRSRSRKRRKKGMGTSRRTKRRGGGDGGEDQDITISGYLDDISDRLRKPTNVLRNEPHKVKKIFIANHLQALVRELSATTQH